MARRSNRSSCEWRRAACVSVCPCDNLRAAIDPRPKRQRTVMLPFQHMRQSGREAVMTTASSAYGVVSVNSESEPPSRHITSGKVEPRCAFSDSGSAVASDHDEDASLVLPRSLRCKIVVDSMSFGLGSASPAQGDIFPPGFQSHPPHGGCDYSGFFVCSLEISIIWRETGRCRRMYLPKNFQQLSAKSTIVRLSPHCGPKRLRPAVA